MARLLSSQVDGADHKATGNAYLRDDDRRATAKGLADDQFEGRRICSEQFFR
jgi:hypothetical protein